MNKLKILIKFIIYYFINLVILPSKNIKSESLLLIRLDAIGDYILFRNYIEVLKKSEKYKEYKITLLGNSAWKTLSEELDCKYIVEFIWLDRNKFNKDFLYRYKKLKEITSHGYEVVLSPVYSREFFYGDTIVKLVYANEKIGSIGDTSNMRKWQKNISDKYYTKLISADNEVMFEFHRNKEFFENLLGIDIDIHKTNINLQLKKLHFELLDRYVILFIGASASFRKWPVEKFANVAQHLKKVYEYEIVLCGGATDVDDANEFSRFFKGRYLDLVGKTSLVELLYVIYNGNLMITNETSAAHAAIALEMRNVFVISNGNHYGRFTPYPKDVSENYHVIYHPKIEENSDNHKKLINSYGFGSELDIKEISIESVIEKIDHVIQLNKLEDK